MPFDQFPPVYSCCFIIKNLKFGTLLLSLFSIVRGLDIMILALVPYCRNFFAVHGFYMAFFAALTAGTGVLIILSSISMALQLILYNKPSVDFYIISVFLSVGMTILYFCTAGMRTLTGSFQCDGWLDTNNSTTDRDFSYAVKTASALYMFLDFIIVGLVMIHFTLVANQYALEARQRAGADF